MEWGGGVGGGGGGGGGISLFYGGREPQAISHLISIMCACTCTRWQSCSGKYVKLRIAGAARL